MKKTVLIFLAIVLILGGAVAFRNNWQKRTGGETIKIGVVYGFTGGASAWAEYGKKGDDLAVKEINEAGGVSGRSIQIIYEDSATTPSGAVASFKKLTEIDKVDIVVGDVWSFLTNPLIPLADSKKIVLISPTVNDKTVEGKSDYFFTSAHTIGSQKQAVEKFFDINPQIKTASILCWNDTWGRSHSVLFKAVMKEKNIKLLGEECTADFSSDYRTEVTKLKVQKPDAILATVTSSLVGTALQRIKELDINAKILTTNAIVDSLEVSHTPRKYTEGVYFTNWTSNQEFIDKFEKMYGTYPIIEAEDHYETIRSIAKAFANDPTDVLAGLKQVKYEGVNGPIDFTTGDHLAVNKQQAGLFLVTSDGYKEIK